MTEPTLPIRHIVVTYHSIPGKLTVEAFGFESNFEERLRSMLGEFDVLTPPPRDQIYRFWDRARALLNDENLEIFLSLKRKSSLDS